MEHMDHHAQAAAVAAAAANNQQQQQQHQQHAQHSYMQHQQPEQQQQQQQQIPAFLTKTFEIVSDPTTDHIISWTETGDAFIITNTADFCARILPTHFKHNNLASFVRQLNIYGFQKVGNKHMWEFRHERFRRNERSLLTEIKRKQPNNSNKRWEASGGGGEGESSQKTETILTELLQLKQRQELLEMNLVQVMNTNDSLWNDLVVCKQQQREIQENLQKILYFLMTVYQNDEDKQGQLPQQQQQQQQDQEQPTSGGLVVGGLSSSSSSLPPQSQQQQQQQPSGGGAHLSSSLVGGVGQQQQQHPPSGVLQQQQQQLHPSLELHP